MKSALETRCPATRAGAESPADARIERGHLEGPAGASEIGPRGHGRANTPGKCIRKFRSVAIDEINRAALADFPAVLARILPGGEDGGGDADPGLEAAEVRAEVEGEGGDRADQHHALNLSSAVDDRRAATSAALGATPTVAAVANKRIEPTVIRIRRERGSLISISLCADSLPITAFGRLVVQ
jgi:hypothetical protein